MREQMDDSARRTSRTTSPNGALGRARRGTDGGRVVGRHVESDTRSWTFLTNHAHVLITISRNPELRQRDISELVGITEGAVQRILHELEVDGYVARERVGRRNRYAVLPDRPLRHPIEAGHTIEEIIDTVNRSSAVAG